MTAIISEAFESRKFNLLFDSGQRELIYVVENCDTETDAQAIVQLTAPAVYEALIQHNISGEPIGHRLWKVTVSYGDKRDQKSKEKPSTGDSSFSFDTTGATQKVTQSLGTTLYPDPGAPDFKGAINVQANKVEGVDLVVGRIRYVETHYLATAAVTAAYVKTLAGLTGSINDATFKGFAAEEVLFAGASGNKRGNGDDWEVQFSFDIEVNQTGLAVGTITGVAKKGWQYLWTHYADDVDEGNFALVKDPTGVYVEDVYPKKDFTDLGIGV